MNEDVKKHLRTQGKYSNKGFNHEEKSFQKSRDKRQKVSPAAKEPQEKKFHKRNSNGYKGASSSLGDKNQSPVTYQENSDYSFSQLDVKKEPIEITDQGKYVLSNTDNGESSVLYEPFFMEDDEASDLMDRLYNSTNWNERNIVIHGKEYPQPRLVAWYGPFPYSYSGATLEPAEMADSVLEIKKKVEEYLNKNGINVTLNSVLLNLYRSNKDSVSWHSDDELTMGVCPTIASVSLGASRKFEMRRKVTNFEDSYEKVEKYFVHLIHGSLLIMNGSMQKDWQHQVPKEYHDRSPRINLTFRTVYAFEKILHVPANDYKTRAIEESVSNRPSSSQIELDDKNFPPLNTVSPVCSDINSSHDRSKDFKSSRRTDDVFDRSCKTWGSEPSYNKNTSPLCSDIHSSRERSKDFNSSMKTDDGFNISCEAWDIESSHNKIDISREAWDIESSYNKNTSSFLNNSNDDKKNVKTDLQNKNLLTCDNSLSGGDAVYANVSAEENKSFGTTESHNISMNSPINNIQEEVYMDKKKQTYSRNTSWRPNIEAKEFIPVTSTSFPVPPGENAFSSFGLINLLQYDVDFLQGELFDYAVVFKSRVLQKMYEFKDSEKEELELLCELTDGSQTDKNQKLITKRMCLIVDRTLGKQRKSFGHPRQPNYGNRDHYSDRRSNFRGRSNCRRF